MYKFGGAGADLTLKKDALLGVYRIEILRSPKDRSVGSSTFRLEEYKKPEFEVTVKAPTEPVALGEKITAKIVAKYYFGSPVTDAKVKYKVMRTKADANWYPHGRWDWLFGNGYWWFGYDYYWLSGWRSWGCSRPSPWWWGRRGSPQPELVAENTVELTADGTASIEIDTALAKAIHPDQDHKYSITVEVTDKSRRTIVGSGSVLVARKPFKVYAWVDRGFYRIGDTVEASFQARRLDGKAVAGKGELKLFKISYEKGKPVETQVQQWALKMGQAGRVIQKIQASRAGQYRLSFKLTDVKGHVEEGGYVFSVWGDESTSTGGAYRFNAIELTPDRKQYAPGQTVQLRVNTAQPDSTVLLFVRPSNGVYLPPKMLKIKGKSTMVDIKVAKKDMPNFFIEAVTISGGMVHTECRQIVVPPEKRVLKVKVQPSKEKYKPGEKAKVKVQISDATGEPVVGSVVLTMYDKAVEYISGGSNVPGIKKFFWDWKRHHSPASQTNLGRTTGNLVRPKAIAMSFIGAFGRGVADEPGPGDRWGIGVDYDKRIVINLSWGVSKGYSSPRGAIRYKGGGRRTMKGAVPMSAMKSDSAAEAEGLGDDGGESQMAATTVRTKFADTALWVGNLTTDSAGMAEVSLTMPENLTTWKTLAWAMGSG